MAKRQGLTAFRPKLVSVAVASCFVAGTALGNPTGPTVVNGNAAINQVGNLLQVTNTPNAIINWQSFSIGANEITRFIQQSQASAVLNRVVGAGGAIDPSVILGTLQSNGRVFLINPSGVLFGAGAQVDVAGLVATSLNLSNADFLANRLKFSEVAGAGSVVNQGNITTGSAGNVYLVGPAVTNKGIITSPQGEVVLAAGNSVELVNPGTPNLRVEISAPDNQAVNLGQVVAESGRVGIYAGLIRNSGTVSASSAVAEGGKILLKATKNVTLDSSSILDASGAGGGTIEVLAKNGGSVNVAGKLDASAPVSGNGGFIETSADKVKIADGTVIRTGAANGKSGMWLIDPNDFTIAAYGGDMSGSTLSGMLNDPYGGDVTLTTLSNGTPGGNGDIFVNDAVSWSANHGLYLLAQRNLDVNQPITSTGGGGLSLTAGWDGVSDTLSPNWVQGTGTITINAPISVSSFSSLPANISMNAGKDINVLNSISASAPYGGSSSISLNAGNDINVNGAVLDANGAYGATVSMGAAHDIKLDMAGLNAASYGGGSASATVDLEADNKVTIQGGSAITTYSSSYYSEVDIEGTNGITIDGSSITAGGYYSYIDLYTDGAGSEVKILNGSNLISNGSNYASVYMWADGAEGAGAGKVSVMGNSNVSASSAYGGSYVTLVGGAELNIDGSTVSASAPNSYAYVDLYANGPTGQINVTNNSLVSASGYSNAEVYLGADGGEGGPSAGKIKVENSTISASSEWSGAYVTLSAGSGGISVDGGEGIHSSSSNSYATTQLMTTGAIQVGATSATNIHADGAEGASVSLMAFGNIDVKNGSLIDAIYDYYGCCYSNTAQVNLWSYGGDITLDNSTVHAYAPADYATATVGLVAAGSINILNGSSVEAYADGYNSNAVIGVQAYGGSIALNNSAVEASADGGEGGVAIAGLAAATDIALTGGASVTVESSSGPTLVGMLAGNNVTVQGNVTSNGIGFTDGCEGPCGANWFSSFLPGLIDSIPGVNGSNFTGIAIQAGNQIIGGPDGLLSVVAGQSVGLRATNGIGTQAMPVRINEGGEDRNVDFQNIGSTGDIAVSFATGDITIDEDVLGTFNNNPSGTYFITVESGNFTLNAPFQPGPDGGPGADLGSQSLFVKASGSVLINSDIRATTGSTSLTGANVTQSAGTIAGLLNAEATAGDVTLTQADSYTLGLAKATGTVNITSTGGAIADGNAGVNVVTPGAASLVAASGIGSLGDPLETQVASISLASYGGEVGVINTGPLTLAALSSSGNAGVQSTDQLTLGGLSLAGNVTLIGNTNVAVNGAVSTSGTLTVQAGTGDIMVSGAGVFSGLGGPITLVAGHDYNHSSSSPLTSSTGNISIAAGHDILFSSGGISDSSGNVFASAGNNVTLSGGGISGNSIGMAAGNTLTVNGASIAGNTIGLSAPVLNVGSSVNATGDLLLVGNAVSVSGSAIAGNVAGVAADTLNVTGGLIQGLDVDMTIGTLINASSSGKIIATSANSIDILFPLLSSGGFMVNSIAGVVDPDDSSTGFFVGGSSPSNQVTSLTTPGFNVTYGTSELPPPVQQAVNQVIAVTNQQATTNDDKKNAAENEDTQVASAEKDKKDLPVCK